MKPAADGDTSSGAPKIAIACPGIGLVQRGFERFFLDIFNLVRDDLDITLFKGGGAANDRERVPRFVNRNGPIPKILPLHRLVRRTPMHTECLTYALSLLPHIAREGYDLVHVIDPPLARYLFHLRNLTRMRFRLLYTEGTSMPPLERPPADHMHHISLAAYEGALALGTAEDYQTLIPCGIHSARFATAETREELRARHGVLPGTFVILCVAAICRDHKRVDYLIEEAARLDGDVLLWLDGSLDHGDPDLVDLARQRLGDRCRVTRVPSDSVGELYGLADVLTLCSLHESFGLVLIEAASVGLRALSHDSPHFRWLFPAAEDHVDMSRPGALAERLRELMPLRGRLGSTVRAEEARERFEWAGLKPRLLELYDRVMTKPVLRTDPLPRRPPTGGQSSAAVVRSANSSGR